MATKYDHDLRKKFHEIDKEFHKFMKEMEKKYDVPLGWTGCIEFNSLTILMCESDAKQALTPKLYKKYLEFRP